MRMTVRTSRVAKLLCLVAFAASGARGQTYTCLPDTAESASVLHDYLVGLVTGSDSASVATRTRYQLPVVVASKVTVETSSRTCNSAGAAYHAAETPSGTPPISRTLVVVKVGNTRYVVLDPNHLVGEYDVNVVFDAGWAVLTRFSP